MQARRARIAADGVRKPDARPFVPPGRLVEDGVRVRGRDPLRGRLTDRVLTQRELNRALLARQHLLERATTTIPKALERVGGIQAQYAPSMYVGLWSRLEGLQREALTRALERKTAIQATLMRATIHLVSRRDYWPLLSAIEQGQREWWLRVTQSDERVIRANAKRARAFLADGPRRWKELEAHLGGREQARGVGTWLPLVRVPPSGTWEQRRADLVAASEDWIGRDEVDPDAAVDLIVRRYLAAFGPARKAEIADWAGMNVRALAPAFERLELRRFRDEQGKELLDLPRAPLPDPETPAPPSFLGTWDATLLVHARRAQILPEEHRPRIFSTKTPHSFNTFLVDGAVAGTWKHEDGRIRLEPFGKLDASVKRELEDEAERLGAFVS
jgi:Winged helix DNA-binding domain